MLELLRNLWLAPLTTGELCDLRLVGVADELANCVTFDWLALLTTGELCDLRLVGAADELVNCVTFDWLALLTI